MANTNLVRIKTRLGLYLIGLAQSHMVFMMSLISVEESPRQMFNMYLKHLKFTSSQQSLFQSWYQLGGQYFSSFKSQTDFMLKLKDIANDCSFTNSDEVVKFLFLTHNQNSRVKDALLDKMKGTSTLTECLAIAKTVESTIETEKLSKTFLQNVNKPETTDVDEVNRSKRQNQNRSGGRGQRFNW